MEILNIKSPKFLGGKNVSNLILNALFTFDKSKIEKNKDEKKLSEKAEL
jgi:hypothetical protein